MINAKALLALGFLLAFNSLMAAPVKIVYGSCARQERAQQMWSLIDQEKADLFMMLGDNVYADASDEQTLRKTYALLEAQPSFQKLRKSTKILATWDDHDYGLNDSGNDNPIKDISRTVMLDFFNEPKTSLRRSQDGGIYTSQTLQSQGHSIHIIMLDTRWNRSPLIKVKDPKIVKERFDKHFLGRNLVNEDVDATILGKTQWAWLEQELKKPADMVILVSSIQVLAEYSGYESWSNFPHEQKRLLKLLGENSKNSKLLFIASGDAHRAEFAKIDGVLPYPLWDITASAFNEKSDIYPSNKPRIALYNRPNYGVMEVEFSPRVQVTVTIKDQWGQVQMKQVLTSTF
jgi:alkaline phosphatase D